VERCSGPQAIKIRSGIKMEKTVPDSGSCIHTR
jgi:hypothetical protein